MPNLNDDEKNRLFMTLDAQTRQLERLERGVYGDKENGVKGMIARIEHIESWITKSKQKIAYISGACAVIAIGLKMAWDYVLEHFKKS